jgi:hypothetical protein
MPNLKTVVACEKVIYATDGPVSLLSVFDAMQFQLSKDAPLPERAIAPNQWAVFTMWEIDPSEINQPFTQVVRIMAPDGSLFLENEHAFASNDPTRIQTRVRLNVKTLPIWQEGKVEIKVSLRGNDIELGSTSFNIVYLPKEEDVKAIEAAKA